MKEWRDIVVGTAVATAVLLVVACAPAASPTPLESSSPEAISPTATSAGRIEHATGPTDIVLRFDSGFGDYGICELCGGWGAFTPGPEFTLYGDGTVIFRNELAQPPPAEGPIIRASPLTIASLDEEQIQSLLRFVLGEGGLETARERYDTNTDTDDPGYSTFTIRAGGVDKRVEIVGSNSPFEFLADHLRNFDRGGNVSTQVWVPDRYWGLLIEAGSWIEVGVLRDLPDSGAVPWPWPGIAPWVFGTATQPGPDNPRRVMSADEAAVLGLSDNGGVVQRIYLVGPDGETIYSFSLWPMLPDETAPSPVTTSPPAESPAPPPAAMPTLTPGPLRIDGLARVVTDRLRVRSAPEVSAASERLEPLLKTGTMLFVIEGPVAGSGYDWYRVAPATFGNGGDQGEFRYWGDPDPIGWVASADRDGTPWIVGARADCPDLAGSNESLSVVERLGPLVALSCYGDASIQFRAQLSSPGFSDLFGEGTEPDPMYPSTYWAAPLSVEEGASFGTVLDPIRFPNGFPDTTIYAWMVVGHFDDGAAATCGTNGNPEEPFVAAIILTCRTTFVVTDLVPFEPIDLT